MIESTELNEYVVHRNAINALFGDEPFDLTTTKGRNDLRDHIDCDLSPENLTCDGELPAHRIAEKKRNLYACRKALDELEV